MTEKKHYGYNDLYDKLLADITPKRAVELKNMVKDISNYRVFTGLFVLVLWLALLGLMMAGLMCLGDYMGWNEKPTDWVFFGQMWLILGLGTMLGYVFATSDHIDRIRRRITKIIDDSVTEGDKS